jgi:hypothetical protein
MAEEYERQPPEMRKMVRRRPDVIVSGFTLLRLAQIGLVGAVAWGVWLGDTWLWRLLHG